MDVTYTKTYSLRLGLCQNCRIVGLRRLLDMLVDGSSDGCQALGIGLGLTETSVVSSIKFSHVSDGVGRIL